MKLLIYICLVVGLITLSISLTDTNVVEAQTPFDWKSDWAVEKGFSLSIDSEGYDMPTAIAFVPNPGPKPDDPLYFVTEMNGRIKVVTNDRTVHTFIEDFFDLEPIVKLPWRFQEVGLAGICLEPKQGYVFVTFAYQDPTKVLRNNIIRFQTKPETFSLEPETQVAFTETFLGYESAPSHQIGPCQVKDDFLYVSVGDGEKMAQSQDTETIQGKILRMTLDGKPVPDNPFYQDDDVKKAANYVWAYGLRNPFGQKIVGDQLFVADNGPGVDRFLEVQRGENYLWDGSDWSIGAKADGVIYPSVGPVQLDYYPQSSTLFPEEYRQKFFVALSGNLVWTTEPAEQQRPGVLLIDYAVDKHQMHSTPQYFLRYRGPDAQMVTGLAFGQDGLYFAPLYANKDKSSAIYKVTYEPEANYPFNLASKTEFDGDPLPLMYRKGCFGCHSLGGQGGTVGPPLDRDALVSRLETRLNAKEYPQSLQEIDKLEIEPYLSYKEARQEVVAATGEEKVRTWIKYRLLEPRFDNLNPVMPNLALSQDEALAIVDYLVTDGNGMAKNVVEQPDDSGFLGQIKAQIDQEMLPLRYRHLIIFFISGVFLAVLLMFLFRYVRPSRARV